MMVIFVAMVMMVMILFWWWMMHHVWWLTTGMITDNERWMMRISFHVVWWCSILCGRSGRDHEHDLDNDNHDGEDHDGDNHDDSVGCTCHGGGVWVFSGVWYVRGMNERRMHGMIRQLVTKRCTPSAAPRTKSWRCENALCLDTWKKKTGDMTSQVLCGHFILPKCLFLSENPEKITRSPTFTPTLDSWTGGRSSWGHETVWCLLSTTGGPGCWSYTCTRTIGIATRWGGVWVILCWER